MNLIEKYRRKFEATERQELSDDQIPTPITNALSEEAKEAYEKRAAIIEYDGGLDRKEAERQAWCRTACMLSFPSQWETCERFKPKPCLKLQARLSVVNMCQLADKDKPQLTLAKALEKGE